MDRALLIYNICGISKDNTDVYPHYLDRIISQQFNGEMKIVVSACMPQERTIPHLRSLYPQCDFNIIHDKIPVNCSNNHAKLEAIKRYGKFDGYFYITCDSVFQTTYDIQNLFNIIKTNPNAGMVSARIDRDSCYAYGMGWGPNHPLADQQAEQIMFQNGDWKVPVGRACAAHVNLYSNKIQDYYGRCIPDIFSGYCTESVFTTICGALGLDWIISKDVLVRHTPSLDTPSAGFRPEAEGKSHIPTYYQGFGIENLEPIFNDTYKKLGGALEYCQNIIPPDMSQFDENGHCINNELKEYVKNNLYLPQHIFDYDKVNSEWIDTKS